MNITLLIVIVTCVTSVIAFSNRQWIDHLIFWPYRIWHNNEWHRLVSCGFIHADLGHLFFNMFAFFSFGAYIEASFVNVFEGKGLALYVIMYFGAVATADIFNLFSKRDEPSYKSLGASGGVAAIIFSYILLNPYGGISLFFLPAIPAYIFGPLFLLYCAYMAKRGGDNIAHMAHLTGSVFGFVFPILFEPRLFTRFIGLLTHSN